jgi:ribonuclease BN (tRNA processing enzyme)
VVLARGASINAQNFYAGDGMYSGDSGETDELTKLSPELLDALIAEAEAGPDPQEFVRELARHRNVRVLELAEITWLHALQDIE